MSELDLQVLLAIGRGAVHGYVIGKEIEERTNGRLDPTTGALYQALKRLGSEGLIERAEAPEGGAVDPRRKYFALTEAGRLAVGAEIRRLEGLVALARERHLYPVRVR